MLPVRGDALARARVTAPLDEPLARLGAEYAYLLDAAAMEGRHWNNDDPGGRGDRQRCGLRGRLSAQPRPDRRR
ncbi:hypothetical protein [Streptomyces sp. WM6368]|uniref:hypothetical protein n=1 Tax=Streptomyces sp. WM6368 TaxID=1415554 RepID=UPI0018FEE8A6|nr:hypothetical protein [Streptomyces sp. WM6368]